VFEPELYGSSTTDARQIYTDVFGPDVSARRDVCAFGFEANPRHCPHLSALEAAYNAHGYRVKLFCPLAVANVDGTTMILKLAEGVKDEHNDWGATTAAGAFREGAPPGVNRTMELEQSDHLPRVEVPVPSVDMAAWYQRNVIDRTLPARGANARDAAIVVKVSRRLDVGALC